MSEWTKDKPKVGGYYWYKRIDQPTNKARLMEVEYTEPDILGNAYTDIRYIGIECEEQLKNLPDNWEYAPAIPPSEEKEKEEDYIKSGGLLNVPIDHNHNRGLKYDR